jgi:hypothetical protein
MEEYCCLIELDLFRIVRVWTLRGTTVLHVATLITLTSYSAESQVPPVDRARRFENNWLS